MQHILIGMVTDFPDFGLNGFEIDESLRTAVGVAEDGGGVEEGGHPDTGLVYPLPVFPGDLKILPNQTASGNAPQTHDNFGLDQGDLIAKLVDAGILLGVQGIPVLGRAAFDDVRYRRWSFGSDR